MTPSSKCFSEKELEILSEVLEVIRGIFRETTQVEPKLFLIGMNVLRDLEESIQVTNLVLNYGLIIHSDSSIKQ